MVVAILSCLASVLLLSAGAAASGRLATAPHGHLYDASNFGYDLEVNGPQPASAKRGIFAVQDSNRLASDHSNSSIGPTLRSAVRIHLRHSSDFVAPNSAVDDFANWGDEISDGARMVDQGLGVPFRSDTSHIFRDAPGHFAQDTAANRALITSAVQQSNLVDTVTVGGQTIRTYQRVAA